MGEYTTFDDGLRDFIGRQRVFFVGTAPLSGDGHVNVSPKGLDSFRVLGPTRVGYLDLAGSGIETVSHVRENGRIVFLFCAFEGAPRILRLHGNARVVTPRDPEWEELAAQFPREDAARTIVVAEIHRMADACGFGVPRFLFEEDRQQLRSWAKRKGSEGLGTYIRQKNATSIDGLPGLQPPEAATDA